MNSCCHFIRSRVKESIISTVFISLNNAEGSVGPVLPVPLGPCVSPPDFVAGPSPLTFVIEIVSSRLGLEVESDNGSLTSSTCFREMNSRMPFTRLFISLIVILELMPPLPLPCFPVVSCGACLVLDPTSSPFLETSRGMDLAGESSWSLSRSFVY
jgi:hypothetical protein